MTDKKPRLEIYRGLFESHPWLAHFLVHVIKRICGMVSSWIDEAAKPYLDNTS